MRHAIVDASVEFYALLLEISELTQPRLAAWIGVRLRLNDRFWRRCEVRDVRYLVAISGKADVADIAFL
jgi:hypothetical protein